MRGNRLFFGNLNPESGISDIFPIEHSHLSQGLEAPIFSQFASFIDGTFNRSNRNVTNGALTSVSKFAGTFLLWLSTGFKQNLSQRSSNDSRGPRFKQDLLGSDFCSISGVSSGMPLFFSGVANTSVKHLWREIEQLRYHPVLSAVAAFVPPYDQIIRSSKTPALPLETPNEPFNGCGSNGQGCGVLSLPDLNFAKDAVEPRTGIKFPTILDDTVFGQDSMEVLVGTGYRTMRVIKVKTLNVYAFGLYVHPNSVCERLGPKYGSIPGGELKSRLDFYHDLLREDVHMTVRLVVNCNGLKINTVRAAFEKSLRARLEKMNPTTDYHCLSVFGSYFKRDIPLPPGTTIDFRRTTDGIFVTEISGKTIGTVHSRDLCRAFFDMYVGDLPVSSQAKEELAENVAGLIRRC